MPDAAVTPEAPSSVVLSLGGPGEVLADWDDVANADHYRVFKQEVGIDADFVVAGSPSDSDFMISGVGGGNTLRIKVSAVSGSLEGQPSPGAEIAVPAGGTLSAPTGLQLQAGPMNSIIATWNAVTDATNYEVEKQLVGTDPDFSVTGSTGSTTLQFGAFSSGDDVRVRIRAFGTTGPGGTPQSPYSAVAEITFP